MNHLREIVEAAGAGQVLPSEHFKSEPFARAVIGLTIASAERAVCFDLGEIDERYPYEIEPALVRMPHHECWFEASVPAEKLLLGVYAVTLGAKVVCAIFARLNATWVLAGYYDGDQDLQTGRTIPAAMGVVNSGVMTLVAVFLTALHCRNVHRVEHTPAAALQKARARRGKQPLFSYWTLDLDLDPSDESARTNGGTDIRVRLHLRRGHPRQYAPGAWTWVRAHLVGDGKLGYVHKDYRVAS